jgi:hypothetical protein
MNDSGVCTTNLIDNCADRKVNSSEATLPCGSSDCYEDINGNDGDSCVLYCSNSNFYHPNNTICVFIGCENIVDVEECKNFSHENCIIINNKCGNDPECEKYNETCNITTYCKYDDDEKSNSYGKCILDWCAQFNRTSCLDEGKCYYQNSVCKHTVIGTIDAGTFGSVAAVAVVGSATVGAVGIGLNKLSFD